ncbi:hypothetical protein [Halovulum sp. GXIMD14793]
MLMFPFANWASSRYVLQAAGHPGGKQRKAKMSFNDLAKKEAAEKRALQEKDPKSQSAPKQTSETMSEATDPKTA